MKIAEFAFSNLPRLPSKEFQWFYTGYAISCLGNRLLSFLLYLLLERLGGIRLIGVEQFVEGVAIIALCTPMGNWLDSSERWLSATATLTANNLFACVMFAVFTLSIWLHDGGSHQLTMWTLSAVTVILCAVVKCTAAGLKIVYTRDWLLVLADREQERTPLAARNGTMTTVDQLSAIVAPFAAGLLMSLVGYRGVCFLLIAWHVATYALERHIFLRLYEQVVELHGRANTEKEGREGESIVATSDAATITRACSSIRTYVEQSCVMAAVSLALLHMTTLAMGGASVGYGKAYCLSDDTVGLYSAGSSLLGLVAALTYSFTATRIGIKLTGLLGFCTQNIFLCFCVVSVWLPGSLTGFTHSHPSIDVDNSTESPSNSSTSILVYYSAITLSRYGLWTTDLAIHQLMQETVEEAQRGRVFGVQTALCQLFTLLKDAAIIAIPDPHLFAILIVGSYTCVSVALLCYLHCLSRV